MSTALDRILFTEEAVGAGLGEQLPQFSVELFEVVPEQVGHGGGEGVDGRGDLVGRAFDLPAGRLESSRPGEAGSP